MQIRKLEFLLADAIAQGCDSVITFGFLQSNHARATVLASRECGLQTHVMILNSTTEEDVELGCDGNLLLNRLTGAKLIVFPTRTDISIGENMKMIYERMYDYARKLRYMILLLIFRFGTFPTFLSVLKVTRLMLFQVVVHRRLVLGDTLMPLMK